ncbi:MAG: hypothetical protein K6F97_02935 [Lachnospiraceae bacterium]|nr:hypothetical protein [Lachnospiraceae bacterium]
MLHSKRFKVRMALLMTAVMIGVFAGGQFGGFTTGNHAESSVYAASLDELDDIWDMLGDDVTTSSTETTTNNKETGSTSKAPTGVPTNTPTPTKAPTTKPTKTTTVTPTPYYNNGVWEVSLSEDYNEEYGIYEFGIGNRFFFYSNVENGAITSNPVKPDIPSNITIRVEKDGEAYSYKRGSEIKSIGSYVIILRVSEEVDGVKRTYRSAYRFRIVKPLPTETPTPTPKNSGSIWTGGGGYSGGGTYTAGEEERVVELSLSEQYYQEYDLYEFGLNGRFFFYSNLANGEITKLPVTLEIPDNLTYTCEKDGKAITYKQGTAIKKEGSYVFTFKVKDGSTTYYSIYHFRILEDAVATPTPTSTPTPEPTEAIDDPALPTTEPAEDRGENQGGAGDSEVTPTTEPMDGDVSDWDFEDFDSLTEAQQEALLEALEKGEISGEEFLNPDGSFNQDAIDKLVEEALDEAGINDGIHAEEDVSEVTGLKSGYDYNSGYYKHTLMNGMSFYTDVPQGMTTRRPVMVRAEEGITLTVYKDGVLYENESGETFSEIGSYMVYPSADDVFYYEAYQEKSPYFSFKIIASSVNDLSVVNAPEGFLIEGVYLSGANCKSAKIYEGKTAMLLEDGTYRIVFGSEDQSIELEFTLDRERPRIYLEIKKNLATIAYYSSDVSNTTVYRGNQLVSDGSVVDTIDKSGKYTLYISDVAGNSIASSFTVKFGLNLMGIVALLIIILAIVGIYFYLKRLNSKVKVR